MAQQTPLELVNRLQKIVQSSETNSKSNSKELRLEACDLAYKLFREFEEPGDMISRVVCQVCLFAREHKHILTKSRQMRVQLSSLRSI
jgi:hypothetical protein